MPEYPHYLSPHLLAGNFPESGNSIGMHTVKSHLLLASFCASLKSWEYPTDATADTENPEKRASRADLMVMTMFSQWQRSIDLLTGILYLLRLADCD